jgi:acetyl esterase/lipase
MRDHAQEHDIDPQRIAGWGYSAGAHLVSLLGTTDTSHGLEGSDAGAQPVSTRLQAVVAGGTPCDFRVMPSDSPRLAYWLGGTRSDLSERYVLASPAAHVSADDPPFFFYHGTADELVPADGVQAMDAALEEAGVRAEVLLLPDANHIQAALRAEGGKAGVQFLDEVLKP